MLPNVNDVYCSVPLQGSLFTVLVISMWNLCWLINGYSSTDQEAACATPYKGIVIGWWKGNCLTEHGCPLAKPLGMPSGHVAHASLRGDAWIHYYLLMDYTDNNDQTISNRWVLEFGYMVPIKVLGCMSLKHPKVHLPKSNCVLASCKTFTWTGQPDKFHTCGVGCLTPFYLGSM